MNNKSKKLIGEMCRIVNNAERPVNHIKIFSIEYISVLETMDQDHNECWENKFCFRSNDYYDSDSRLIFPRMCMIADSIDEVIDMAYEFFKDFIKKH